MLSACHACGAQVFQAEYNLMCDIATCPIPYASLCDGIWMGLGVGLAVHGDVRTTPAFSGSLFQDKCPRKSASYRGGQQGSALALNVL